MSPSSHPAWRAVEERAVRRCKADWFYIVSEIHRRGQMQKSDVVVICDAVVVWMIYDLRDVSVHLIGIWSWLRLSAQVHDQIIGRNAVIYLEIRR